MQQVATFIMRALSRRDVDGLMYLDDLVMLSPRAAKAHKDYQTVLEPFDGLGLKVANKKCQTPSSKVTWLGYRH